MIHQGSNGSLSLYYKGLLISSFALTNKKTFKRYNYQGEHLILKSIRENIKIPLQIETYIYFCNTIHRRKLNKQSIRRRDHEMFMACLFALMKLQIIRDDSDNGTFIMPRLKKR